MAVIINEFEVVVDEAQSGTTPGSRPVPGAVAQAAPSPQDIADILRHRAERMARLEAH